MEAKIFIHDKDLPYIRSAIKQINSYTIKESDIVMTKEERCNVEYLYLILEVPTVTDVMRIGQISERLRIYQSI